MIRKGKQFSRPKKAYEKTRIEEENVLVEKYGLKNKREIWKTLAAVNYYRTRGKELAKASSEEQEVLFNKLRALGLDIKNTTDVLALQVEDILKRRLPSMVASKKLAQTPQQARQMVVHKKVRIDGRVVNVPSYLVPVSEENKIVVEKATAKAPKQEKEVAE
ncbi:MAG TPA: 30S ribosomal protein S4 [Candidatus Nanoarchaeia archaeon]|nr:30S ribosomal protein S4 [Candidatus Nanoarchaeia archaeon]